MYANFVTGSMKQAIDETNRRRKIQESYNIEHEITPETIEKDIISVFPALHELDEVQADRVSEAVSRYDHLDDLDDIIRNLEKEMEQAAKELAFERASELRDQIKALKKMIVFEL
jgi:excinuclease ABC subunit B